MHEDDEIRWVQEGSGFFDVRDAEDDWVRVWAEEGDFICLPGGIYHRFSVDQGQVGGFDFGLLCSALLCSVLDRGTSFMCERERADASTLVHPCRAVL